MRARYLEIADFPARDRVLVIEERRGSREEGDGREMVSVPLEVSLKAKRFGVLCRSGPSSAKGAPSGAP